MSLSASYAIAAVFNGKDKLSPVISKIEKKYGSMAGNVGKAVGKMNTAINKMAKVGFAAGVATVAVLTKETIAFAKAGDEAAKTSRRIGMSAEALQELKFAADRAGVSGDETVKSFEKLNKNVGDLRAGTGSLKTILDKSNPALAAQLKNAKNNEEAFNLITNAVNKLPNQMDKAALAQAAFGRSGLKMLTVMENGTKGIEDLRKEARKYGGIISNKAAKQSEEFVDAMTNMKAVMTGLKYSALTPLMQSFGPLIQMLSDYIATNKAMISMKIQSFFTAIADAVKKIKLGDIDKAFKSFVKTLKTVNSIVQKLGGWSTFGEILVTLVVGVKALSAAMSIMNVVIAANPVGLVTLGIIIFVAEITILIKKFDQFGAAVFAWIGLFSPVYAIINPIILLFRNFSSIIASFKAEGFIGGIKTIGAVLLQSVLTPINQILTALSKIPGIGKYIGKLQSGVSAFMDANQRVIDRNNPEIQQQNRAQEIQNRYSLAPNGQRAETEQTKAVIGAGTITVRAEEGTSATVNPGTMGGTGWDMQSLGKDGI